MTKETYSNIEDFIASNEKAYLSLKESVNDIEFDEHYDEISEFEDIINILHSSDYTYQTKDGKYTFTTEYPFDKFKVEIYL